MAKDKELEHLKLTHPDHDWVVEADWHKPETLDDAPVHYEVKLFRDRSGKYTDPGTGEPLVAYQRAELIDGVPLRHMDPT